MVNKHSEFPFVDLDKLPALSSDEKVQYSWFISDYAGAVPETSGIRREFGYEWQAIFGVAIMRSTRILGLFSHRSIVAYSGFPVEKTSRSVEAAAKTVFESWQDKAKS